MPKGTKFYGKGDTTRFTHCKICFKKYKGDIRNVNKQLELHMRYVHNETYTDYARDKGAVNICTGKFIN